MPIVVKLNPVAPLIGAAQNVGNFASGQVQQEFALRQQAQLQQAQQQGFEQNLQERRFADQQQAGQEDLQYKYDLLNQNAKYRQDTLQQRGDLQDQRGEQQVELQNLRSLAQTGQLDQRGQQRLAQILQQGDISQQRDQRRYDFQGQQGDANRASREAIAGDRTQLSYERIAADDARAEANRQGRMDLSQFNTQQQDQRRATERDYRGQTDLNRLALAELHRKRVFVGKWADSGVAGAAQEFQRLTGEIEKLNQPAPLPQFNYNFQSGADSYGQPPPDVSGLAQPQQQPVQQAATGGTPVQIGSDQEYQALPPGTAYVAPDGSTRIKS